MDVKERLRQKKEAVECELERILPQEDSLLFRAMRHAVFSGGKRYRPLLALSSGEYFGASQEMVLPFACALELIHNYSLVHDDLPSMDNDDFRRGQPSCHKAFGEDIALLTGDSLLTLAFEVLSQASLDGDLLERKGRVIKEISHFAGIKGMIGGQLLDVTLSPEVLTEEIFHDLILKKTGALITASVKTGAILGGAGNSELEALVQYGRHIGLAFQIRDDILDSSDETEKGDLSRPNYVSVFGLETAKSRLNDFINTARSALEEASLESEELHYLASLLLNLEYRKGK
ncbi:MAG: polyprenyl synthetase family protein [Candidatus Aminicenantes bacterium]|jgi:geranylgeranyl diphosphate synthase type II